jgi:hypothetical protein
VGEMKRAEAHYRDEFKEKQAKFATTLVVTAAIIAAVRLAREPDIS